MSVCLLVANICVFQDGRKRVTVEDAAAFVRSEVRVDVGCEYSETG